VRIVAQKRLLEYAAHQTRAYFLLGDCISDRLFNPTPPTKVTPEKLVVHLVSDISPLLLLLNQSQLTSISAQIPALGRVGPVIKAMVKYTTLKIGETVVGGR